MPSILEIGEGVNDYVPAFIDGTKHNEAVLGSIFLESLGIIRSHVGLSVSALKRREEPSLPICLIK